MTSSRTSSRPALRSFAGAVALAAAAAFPGLATAGAAHAAAAPAALVSDPASVVDTLVMTTGGGNDFPGADMPFGMVQWSPDSTTNRNDGGGYDYGASQTRGFSLTHMAGPGCGAMGDIPILPMTGPLPSGDPGVHMESLSHTGEVGNAGYYTVATGSPSVRTELTATQRTGMAKFTSLTAVRPPNCTRTSRASSKSSVILRPPGWPEPVARPS